MDKNLPNLTQQQNKDSKALEGCNVPDKYIYDLAKEEKDLIQVDYRNSNYKLIEVNLPEISDKPLILKQNFILGKGGIFWDGAYFISKYLLSNIFNNYKINSILELGAGTSLPSLTSLIKGPYHVITTDIPKLIPMINEIMDLNKQKFNSKGKSDVIELSWEKQECIDKVKQMNNNKCFDLIIGSELIYLDDLFDDLINVLNQLSDKNTFILFSYKIRLPSMVEDFKNKISKNFDLKYITYNLKDELYPNPEKLELVQIIKKL